MHLFLINLCNTKSVEATSWLINNYSWKRSAKDKCLRNASTRHSNFRCFPKTAFFRNFDHPHKTLFYILYIKYVYIKYTNLFIMLSDR